MKRTIFYLSILVLTALTACEVPTEEEGEMVFDLNAQHERVDYMPNQRVYFTVSNETNETVTYFFSTGCQFGYTLSYQNRILYNSTELTLCSHSPTSLTLQPGISKEFVFALSTVSKNPEQLAKGMYQVNAFLMDGNGEQVSTTFWLE